jgi:DNA-binding NarL/FixJ family response regulator
MKILVVDDHALIRDALGGVLAELVDGGILLEASNCSQALELVQAHPDLRLILLDLALPDRNGLSFLADLRRRYAPISVVVLSGSQDRDTVMRALDLGALGFIPKSSPREIMANALRLVLSGGIYIPPEALAPAGIPAPGPPPAQAVSPRDLGLTERQLEVVALMMQGKSNKAICRILKLAEPTVKNHVTAILKALKVTNRTEAVIKVARAAAPSMSYSYTISGYSTFLRR